MRRTIIIAAAFYGLLITLCLYAHDWNPSAFIVAGANYTYWDDVLTRPGDGYDGQFYYRLALDPLTSRRTDHGVRLDVPSYRQQRILYPALAWFLGRVLPVPWALVLINYASVIAVGWLGALHARRAGHAPELGLAFALWPGFWVAVTRDLPEPLSAALLLAALLVVRRPWLCAALLSLAVLARETALPAALALPLPSVLVPFAAYALWQVALLARWGELPLLAGGRSILALPLSSVPPALLLLIVAFSIPVLMSFRRIRSNLKVPWLVYLALVLSLSGHVWAEPYAYLRAMTEFYLVGVLLLLGDPNSNVDT